MNQSSNASAAVDRSIHHPSNEGVLTSQNNQTQTYITELPTKKAKTTDPAQQSTVQSINESQLDPNYVVPPLSNTSGACSSAAQHLTTAGQDGSHSAGSTVTRTLCLLELMPLQTLTVLLCPWLSFQADHSLLFMARTCRAVYQKVTTSSHCWNHQIATISLSEPFLDYKHFFLAYETDLYLRVESATNKRLAQLRGMLGMEYDKLIVPRLSVVEKQSKRLSSSVSVADGDAPQKHDVAFYPRISITWLDALFGDCGLYRDHDYRALLWPRYCFQQLQSIVISCSLQEDAANSRDMDDCLFLILSQCSSLKSLELDESGDLENLLDLVHFSRLLPQLPCLQTLHLYHFCLSFEHALLPIMLNRTLTSLIISENCTSNFNPMDDHILGVDGVDFDYQANPAFNSSATDNNQLVLQLSCSVLTKLHDQANRGSPMSPEVQRYYRERCHDCEKIIDIRNGKRKQFLSPIILGGEGNDIPLPPPMDL